ncbi:hypothetical protein C8C77_13517 [Halanaerobium saccharolyticum]|uniref:Uncharacterized protein n=1 Tax=Halanaerobium saccharolyticum TaxID=43595 RepID=A0A4V3G430_9FIRM|nr:hypothetical protein [Halanaerobium saccharolyticum]RAK05051.1 hypothetical protein C7958_13117 [Halanaerobium saccharolyticum]TDV98837.1 hypothetical protein C8C77_13517 [Halanaerobium saccharolyticum]TDX51488.1 hypothetical protein C7956_13317 [Halanaerobium saccharolyticum]
MNKAMLCTVKRDQIKKKILIIKNKIATEEHDLKVDYQLEDTDPDVQHLISSQVGQKLKINFLEGTENWKLNSKKMFISNFDYAYDLSSLKDFIDSLILFKTNDREIDPEIINMLKNDIFSESVFWENDNIDQDLTAELILKYWDLDPIESYPENDYYKKLLQFADGEIKSIDQKTADFWFDIPAEIRAKINEQIGTGKIGFDSYLIYLQTRDDYILNNILLNFIREAADESQESINNLFEKFHYQLIDQLTKKALEKNKKIELDPIIPQVESKRSDLELKPELEMKDYSLLEIFAHYSIEVDFESLNLFSEDSIGTLSDYLKSLVLHLDYLNEMRKKLKCDSCGQRLDYDLDYSQKIAAYKVESARCNNLDCEKFDQEINF